MNCTVEQPQVGSVAALLASSAEPVLVDFWGYACQPCAMLAPILDAIAGEYCGRVRIVKSNANDDIDFAAEHGIMALPTLVLFRNGIEVDRFRGFAPKSVLTNWLDGALRDAGR